jgi:hypothetical protein
MADVGTLAMTVSLPAINIVKDPEIIWQRIFQNLCNFY